MGGRIRTYHRRFFSNPWCCLGRVGLGHVSQDNGFGFLVSCKAIAENIVDGLVLFDNARIKEFLSPNWVNQGLKTGKAATNLEKIFNLDELNFVQTVAIRQPTVVHKSEYSSIDSVDGGQHSNRGAVGRLERAQGCQNSSKDDLKKHEKPAQDAQDVIRVEVFGSLGDDISVEAFWKTLRRPIPGRRVDDLVRFSLPDCPESMSYTSPLSWSQEAVRNVCAWLLASLSLWRSRSDRVATSGTARSNWDARGFVGFVKALACF